MSQRFVLVLMLVVLATARCATVNDDAPHVAVNRNAETQAP